MRLIGHLPNEASASTFSDYLYVEGITSEVESEKEGWAVWIHSEDEWAKAKELLSAFIGNPADPKYLQQAGRARQLRQKAAVEVEEVENRTYDRNKVFQASMPYGVGPLTVVLIGLSVIVHVLRLGGYDENIFRELLLTAIDIRPTGYAYARKLVEVSHGEVWRLLTPILVHGDILHLMMNMMGMLVFGSMIEARRGTGVLGLLVVAIGIVSNLGQYYFFGSPVFFGMSGVVYGLLGYVWMKGKFDPGSGLYLHPQTVAIMLIWFVLCFTPLIPRIANGAHAAGLGMGVIWGFLASLKAMRRQH